MLWQLCVAATQNPTNVIRPHVLIWVSGVFKCQHRGDQGRAGEKLFIYSHVTTLSNSHTSVIKADTALDANVRLAKGTMWIHRCKMKGCRQRNKSSNRLANITKYLKCSSSSVSPSTASTALRRLDAELIRLNPLFSYITQPPPITTSCLVASFSPHLLLSSTVRVRVGAVHPHITSRK